MIRDFSEYGKCGRKQRGFFKIRACTEGSSEVGCVPSLVVIRVLGGYGFGELVEVLVELPIGLEHGDFDDLDVEGVRHIDVVGVLKVHGAFQASRAEPPLCVTEYCTSAVLISVSLQRNVGQGTFLRRDRIDSLTLNSLQAEGRTAPVATS